MKRSGVYLIVLIAACACTGLAVYYFLDQKYAAQRSSLETLTARVVQLDSSLAKLRSAQLTIENPLFTRVQLKGTASNPNAHATVYWNSGTREVFVSIYNIPEPNAGQIYQLWAFVNGKLVSAGTFSGGFEGLKKMEPVEKADAFAITIENEPGADTPTLQQLQAIGSVFITPS